jgi:hypothetical protein
MAFAMIRSLGEKSTSRPVTARPLRRSLGADGPQDRVTLASQAPGLRAGGGENGDVHVLWGLKGHGLVNREAAAALPDDMPAFFRKAGDQLEAMASQPDRWKFRGLPRLDAINRPDHHIDYELIGDRSLPPERFGFVGMVAAEHLEQVGEEPCSVGVLPYAIAENLEKLTAEFALWRREVDRSGEDSVLARQLAANAVYTAGLLGHYAGDAAQPLHVSVHHDGWNDAVEPNPDGFDTRPGIHMRFEAAFVNAAVTPDAVEDRLSPARVLDGDTLAVADAFCRRSTRNVRMLYALDRDGKIDPSDPSEEGQDFVLGCLSDGAQFLRDLWYTAWVRSADLARQVHDPEMDYNLAP